MRNRTDPMLRVHAAPFLKRNVTTPGLMRDVLVALVPVIAVAVWFFGVGALLVLAASTLGAAGTEWLFGRGRTLGDGSVVLTGVLLGLVLPPALPLWMAFLGGVVAVGLGKLVWGGLGHNLFNPALLGRAFLQAAFPTALTTWTPQDAGNLWSVPASSWALPLMTAPAAALDAVTTATPLARMKFEQAATGLPELLVGNTAGCLGETSAGLLLVCGLWLGLRKVFDWRIPVAILLTVAVVSGVLYAAAPQRFPTPGFMLLSGGLLFGAVFMATDPVTSPLAPRGAWIFGFGIGFLVVLIRLFGGLPEGVMYAILLMNATTPLLERIDQPRAFGHGRRGHA